MLLSLLVASCLLVPQVVGGSHREKAVDATSELTLTETQPVGRIQLPGNVWAAAVPFLEIPIARISNSEEMGFSILVYLEWTRPTAGPDSAQKIRIGNFTVYPPDRPGSFLLRASECFDKLRQMGANVKTDHLVLLLEMKRVHPNRPWSPIRVTVASVRWRAAL